jgi:hypothetical protein
MLWERVGLGLGFYQLWFEALCLLKEQLRETLLLENIAMIGFGMSAHVC